MATMERYQGRSVIRHIMEDNWQWHDLRCQHLANLGYSGPGQTGKQVGVLTASLAHNCFGCCLIVKGWSLPDWQLMELPRPSANAGHLPCWLDQAGQTGAKVSIDSPCLELTDGVQLVYLLLKVLADWILTLWSGDALRGRFRGSIKGVQCSLAR